MKYVHIALILLVIIAIPASPVYAESCFGDVVVDVLPSGSIADGVTIFIYVCNSNEVPYRITALTSTGEEVLAVGYATPPVEKIMLGTGDWTQLNVYVGERLVSAKTEADNIGYRTDVYTVLAAAPVLAIMLAGIAILLMRVSKHPQTSIVSS